MQRIATAFVIAGLISSAAYSQTTQSPSPTPSPTPVAGQPAEYAAGLKAMNDSHWKEALDDFDKVHDADEDTMAQALYWKAYNLQKLDRGDDASATCTRLRAKYPLSSWTAECAVLRANRVYEIRVKDGDVVTKDIRGQVAAADEEARQYARKAQYYAENSYSYTTDPKGHMEIHLHTGKVDPNDEIKLIALNSLMQQEPDKALPLLRTLLTSDKPIEMRRRAMFVLEQSKSPEAQKLLADMATSNSTPELQRAAVWAIASRPKEHTAELLSIYKNSSDHEVKRAAASGLMSARDANDLIQIARNETDPDMKRTLVSYLGDMHDPAAVAYMEELVKQ